MLIYTKDRKKNSLKLRIANPTFVNTHLLIKFITVYTIISLIVFKKNPFIIAEQYSIGCNNSNHVKQKQDHILTYEAVNACPLLGA